MEIPNEIKNMRLIPLTDYTKIARVKWGNDTKFEFDNNWISYGVDTQRSDLVVIDCDNKNESNGMQNFLDLYAENDEVFPETFTVETPHGFHFYFRAPEHIAIKSSVSKLAKNVDVRGYGGYVVGPGSKVKDETGEIKTYTENSDEKIKDMPQWLVEKLVSLQEVPQENKVPNLVAAKNSVNQYKGKRKTNSTKQTKDSDLEKQDSLNWALARMTEANEGQRQTFLNKTSYFMGVKRVNYNDAKKLVDIAIEKGLPEAESTKTFERAYEDGKQEEEIPPLTAITKEFNTITSTSFKEDPLDSEFYGHVSLSYNFWKKHRHDLLFWQNDGKWYNYHEQKGYWQKIDDDVLRDMLKIFLEEMVLDLRKNNQKIPANIYREQSKLWLRSTLESVMVIARSDFLNRNENLFDSDGFLINCKNGVVNLKTKEILPHDKNLYIRNYIPYDYKPDTKDEYCDKIIESIASEEVDFVQVMAGQALSGEQPSSHVALFLNGGGGNGKSTFIDLMLRTSGTYGKLQTPNVLQPEQNKEIYALSDFEGLRMAIVEELPDSKQLNSGALKRLVGTRQINSRRIYSENRTFENNATLFVSCNKLPTVSEVDEGTWRRLLVISFPYFYKKRLSDVKGDFDKLADQMVIFSAQKSSKTAEAFLAWRVEGAYKWANNKNAENNVPASIRKSVNEWRYSSDSILSWFDQNIEVDTDSYILTMDLVDSYNKWAKINFQSELTLKSFLSLFKNNQVFKSNKIEYKPIARPLVSKTQSIFENTITGEVRHINDKGSFFQGIKFKE